MQALLINQSGHLLDVWTSEFSAIAISKAIIEVGKGPCKSMTKVAVLYQNALLGTFLLHPSAKNGYKRSHTQA